MNSDRKTDILVGLFLFVGLLLLGAIILQFGSLRSYFRDSYVLKVGFPKAAGIKEGSPVYLGGSKVGKVLYHPRLNDTYSGVIIDLEIYDSVEIPLESAIAIGSDGLMGDAMIEIQPSGKEAKEFLPHNYDKIITGQTGGGLSDLQTQAEQVGKKVDLVLDDVRIALVDVKGAMEKINKGALSDATVTDFKESMAHLNKMMTRVDDKVLGEENTTNLKIAIADLKDAATSFKTSAKNVEESSKKLGPMFDKFDPVITKADKAMVSLDESLQSIKKAADTFSIASKNITSGKGILGAMMNDPELKDDFKDLISNLKRNGVLFYKNNAEKEQAEQTSPPPQKPSGRKPLFGR